MISLLLLGLASAGWQEDLRPAAAPWDVLDRWATYAAQQEPPLPGLACDVLVADHVRLCFRTRQGEQLRWVTEADLTAWGSTVEALREHVTNTSRDRAMRPETLPIDGMNRSYARWVDGEGWAVAPLLWAQEIGKQLGPDARFAVPAGTVALAWAAGDGDVDKALAVGVVELAEEQPGEVSRVVFRLDGERLVPFAEATPSAPAPSEAP